MINDIAALPMLDKVALILLVLVLLAMAAAGITVYRGRRLVDRHWEKIQSGGRTLGVVRPTGYLVPDEPRTLEGKRLPARRYRGIR